MKVIIPILVACTLAINLPAQNKIMPTVHKDAPTRTQDPLILGDYSMNKSAIDLPSYKFTNLAPRSLKIEPEELTVIARDEQGTPQWFTGDLAKNKSLNLQQNIANWLDKTSEMLKLDVHTAEFLAKAEWSDNLGQQHIKYDQMHNGVKVFDGEIILHIEGNSVFMQNGTVVPSKRLNTNKSVNISAEQARNIIKEQIPGFKADWNPLAKLGIGKDAKQWEGEQVYYNHEGTYRLAYNYTVFANMEERYEYIVDAHSGDVLNSWSKICKMGHNHEDGTCSHHPPAKSEAVLNGPVTATARDLLNISRQINTYELNNDFFMLDASRPMFRSDVSVIPDEPVGAIWTIDIGDQSPSNNNATYSQVFSNNNAWGGAPEGVSAHYNAGQSYEYFLTVHGRNSINGAGESIVSVVNVADENGNSLGNAFYNGLAIWYGNGDNTFFPLGRALDVAGHELTHGVVENSANLIYQNESGAMNESFSDIFGAMIDREDWLIGEDVVRPGVFPGGALRSLEDPHNGASFGDLGRGWQPKHTNERFTGSEDNGGVHINSGITNHAFYLFAIQVGRDRAEQVFYRALTTYLTRSSGFNELRNAVERSASDLYDSNVVNAASQAFSDVGIGSAPSTNFEQDITPNQGANLLLSSTLISGSNDLDAIFVDDLDTGEIIFNPLSGTDHQSKPSITDDGSRVVFVGTDNHVHFIDIDWSTNPPRSNESIRSPEPIWRNAVISKDGNRIALLEVLRGNGDDNHVTVIDIPTDSSIEFELTNQSFTNGVDTDNVLFADAMEFNYTGDILMFDAVNQLRSATGTGNIEFWNIGFLDVWNRSTNSFADGQINIPLRLESNENVGNPTYSKNSPFIIAFDVLTEETFGTRFQVFGMNTETRELNVIIENDTWSFPNYSVQDDYMVFNYVDNNVLGLGLTDLNDDKISSASGPRSLADEIIFGSWFTTGTRILSDTEELIPSEAVLTLAPVPAKDNLLIKLESETLTGDIVIEIMDVDGRVAFSQQVHSSALANYNLDTSDIISGTYILSLRSENKIVTKKFLKI